jgi:mannose-6-phosphate isomerase class I
VYERFIISFDQKVLTQSHWDVENAFDIMKLKTPEDKLLPILTESDQFKEEEVVNFSDFKVSRVTISESYRLSTNNKHALVYVLKGQVVSASNSSSFELKQGAAYYALPDLGNINLKALEEPSVVLIASPH